MPAAIPALLVLLGAGLCAGCLPETAPLGEPASASTPAPPPGGPEAELQAALEAVSTPLRGRTVRTPPALSRRQLTTWLPAELAGLPGDAVETLRSTAGVFGQTRVHRRYTRGGPVLRLTVTDNPLTGTLLPAALGLTAMTATETAETSDRPFALGEHAGRRRVDRTSGRIEILLLVRRLQVELSAEGFADAAPVDAALKALDLDALAGLLPGPGRRRPPPAAAPPAPPTSSAGDQAKEG